MLGPLEVTDGSGRPVEGGGSRLRTLLILLADVAGAPFARGHEFRLAEQRLGAIEDRVEALLLLGRAEVAELESLVAAHPLRERLRGQYMRDLCAAGRQADALATFEDARRTLAEELGVDPSAELRQLHLAVLRGEPDGPDRERGRTNLRPADQLHRP